MSLRISGKNLDIGEALRQRIDQKVEAAIAKYFDGAVNGHAVITPDGSEYSTERTLHLAFGLTVQADGRAREPYASVDQAVNRIEKQLRRYKRRLKEHHPAGADGRARQP